MRQIGTLPDGEAARTLADYLLTIKIETRLDQQPEGWVVWVCDEDHVPQARQEFDVFVRNPRDPRFAHASRSAHELRLREVEEDEEYRRRLAEFREQMTETAPHTRYVTFTLVIAALLVSLLSGSLLTGFGINKEGFRQLFLISSESGPYLGQIAHGQLWRLLTPIFIHFGILHLLFNFFVIFDLGGQVERQQGSPRLLWLVVLFAVVSNLTQFYLGHITYVRENNVFLLQPNANFGGLSGVGFGLFGYVWMKSRFAPDTGLTMSPLMVTIMLFWFVACLFGLFDDPAHGASVANGAHTGGLVLGLMIGAGPHVFQVLRNR